MQEHDEYGDHSDEYIVALPRKTLTLIPNEGCYACVINNLSRPFTYAACVDHEDGIL